MINMRPPTENQASSFQYIVSIWHLFTNHYIWNNSLEMRYHSKQNCRCKRKNRI